MRRIEVLPRSVLALLLSSSLAAVQGSDCNENGVPDDQDIGGGTSADCNANGVPDECDLDTSFVLDDFDGGGPPAGVTRVVGNYWVISDCCPPPGACGSGGRAAYSGKCSTCSIGGNSGDATITYAGVVIPSNPANAKLRYCYALDCKGDPHEYGNIRVDQTVVDWLEEAALTWPWDRRVADLSAFAGQTVVIRLFFHNGQGLGTGRGLHLDTLRIGNLGSSSDCNGNGQLDECDIASDPALDLDGDGVLDSCRCGVESYCTSTPNSTGVGALLQHLGTTSVVANDFELSCSQAPAGQPALFFHGPQWTQAPFGNGWRCIAPGNSGIVRLGPPLAIGPDGTLRRRLDLTQPPASSGPGQIEPGSMWSFQLWFRDPAGGGAGSNLSDGLTAGFCP